MTPPPEVDVLCTCCDHIIEDGQPRRRSAVYLWHDVRGYRWPLCAPCCAIWREDPYGLERITQLVRLVP